jgi:hypothetical protein
MHTQSGAVRWHIHRYPTQELLSCPIRLTYNAGKYRYSSLPG